MTKQSGGGKEMAREGVGLAAGGEEGGGRGDISVKEIKEKGGGGGA